MITYIGIAIGIALIFLTLQLFGDSIDEEDEFIPPLPFNLNDPSSIIPDFLALGEGGAVPETLCLR